ncbi:GDP-mannose 4,6-dehydratase (EC 4.2.1.47) [uncultured Gammaproteobacteria bacterium]|jgi:GDPmannose 4,6-dehydratase|uniref:GDP-mannose 4,6-dehydratase n=1 Tax=Bathymodiolus azoricus thioautotrophic gill symbiont TaxID=235205 RepID=A0A1H6M5L8_9GAMM|nr:GDP-mannose 4,6-dehydratase [Bathymodiolus azoricus thioautotrophic gill symbiont]CAC9500141.1 GDP-mannose 4,6-dehydratase (EC 4.2.1.47) [uncultured Gammaproteobacteria bacterium]CAC9507614.1 GDP-mannose 4,6-dehydratase (EC 4.2.1.47) [uncultured Gammaproteobacteria bacterium]CAC9981039.1 GDP-mannose 4,6-dehydratase (EC 4.2.1.47) [uncultured Gammaproteobacteria bacterium]CAC9983297.1 GDP-mannose 4,6-dehydratase (EC 4.2.1.47) [uncultured Gammaproteobacteria bacterium]CAC9991016.1 GDP-mannose 
MKKAFITGITGQDGSYLAELLLEKNYEVHAILRRASVFTTQRIEHIFNHPNLHTYHGDLTDSSNIHRLLMKIKPDEIYNLGAQSHVAVSFDVPEYTADVVGLGAIRLLDSVRDLGSDCRYYQASTSELFGGIPGTEPQSETTPFYPKSPYGAAKLYAYWVTVNYRESYNLFACNGILFNHESPRRGETFVTKKITQAVAKIHQGKQEVLTLGNMDAKRDWGHAKDFVYAQWLMLQQDKPQDFVIATGETHTVREFVELAFKEVGTNIEWQGVGVDEKGIDQSTGKILIEVDEKYFRPAEVELLLGDPSKAENELGWERQVSFQELVSGMVRYDLENDGFGGKE